MKGAAAAPSYILWLLALLRAHHATSFLNAVRPSRRTSRCLLPHVAPRLLLEPKKRFEHTSNNRPVAPSVLFETASPLDGNINTSQRQSSFLNVNPSWESILKLPIHVDSQQDFDSLPRFKRMAISSRVSVLHLTLLSTLGPLIFRGALRSAGDITINNSFYPVPALLFVVNALSWHATHNLLNDWQDLNDDDSSEFSFRLSYGCHPLKQGFMSKPQFLRLMAASALPAALLSIYFHVTNPALRLAPAFGLLALFFYTILFKPLALGELLIYLVWGPLMTGMAAVASGAPSSITNWTGPATQLFGLAALAVVLGKHTDKRVTSKKRTLPKVLGEKGAIVACKLSVVLPSIVLITALVKERLLRVAEPTIPLGAALALVTLVRETPATLKVLRLGRVDRPPFPVGTKFPGALGPYEPHVAWPLWFVAVTGWHAIVFGYLLVLGSGLEWILRGILSRVL